MRQKLIIFLGLLFLLSCPLCAAGAEPPPVAGQAGLVMDLKNGQILYQKNGQQKLYPASTTKILTGIIALESSDLDEVVTVSRNAVGVEGTAIGLQAGEKIEMRSLLHGLLLNSANDAAVAIAEYIGGSMDNFARLMNDKARELGATDSHFVNPHGLPDPNHVTTARDLAVIARYAMQNEQFREIVGKTHMEIERGVPEKMEPQTWVYNHNRLLTKYKGATGIKTGYTTAAKFCIVGSARRGNRELIVVVLGGETQRGLYDSAAALLDYGFESFQPEQLVGKDSIITRLDVPHGKRGVLVKAADSLTYNFQAGADKKVQHQIEILPGVEAPVRIGDVVGRLVVRYQGQQVGSVKLIALEEVPRKISHTWWFWPLLVICFLLVPYGLAGIRRRRRRYIFSSSRRRW